MLIKLKFFLWTYRNLIFILIVGILLILWVFWYWYSNLNFDLNYIKWSKISSNLSLYEQQLASIKKDYKNSSKFNSCMISTIDSCMEDNVIKNALENSDLSVCENLSNPDQIERCKVYAIVPKAMSWNNLKLCDQAWTKKNNCIFEVSFNLAKNKKDLKYCDYITWVSLKKDDLLSDPKVMRQNCINEISYEIAWDKKDLWYCEKISDHLLQAECRKYVNLLKK